MRDDIRKLIVGKPSAHVGLAYTTLAPVGSEGKVPDDAKGAWLEALAESTIGVDQCEYVRAWIDSFAGASVRCYTLTLDARLLVGHGNASGADVGLTVHHTWGTPIVPGSALKGIVAHHVASTYGADPSGATEDPARDPWRGVGWRDKRIARGPGELYRLLFGAPDADDDRTSGAPGAAQGHVVFHDALYLGCAPREGEGEEPAPAGDVIKPACKASQPFAADTLTVHQKPYYDKRGQRDPNDHDDPIPVGFLTVRPGAQFVLVLEGPPDWTALAGELLSEALAERGVGGKTTSGYGRARLAEGRAPALPPSRAVAELRAWLKAAKGAPVAQRDLLPEIRNHWLMPLRDLSDHDRAEAVKAIKGAFKRGKFSDQVDALCAELTSAAHRKS